MIFLSVKSRLIVDYHCDNHQFNKSASNQLNCCAIKQFQSSKSPPKRRSNNIY